MTGLFVAIGAALAIWCALSLRRAWLRTSPDALLRVARPVESPEDIECRLTAELLSGAIDPDRYRRAVAQLAETDASLAISR
jgi:hypothetical protein